MRKVLESCVYTGIGAENMDIKVKTPFEFVDHVASIYGWADLKEKLGVSKQSISNWKLGKREPSAEVILMCLALLQEDGKQVSVCGCIDAEEFT